MNVAPVLKENSGTVFGESHAGRRLGLGSWLVVAQVALSVVALIGAGLMVRTVNNLRNVEAGFDTRNILLFGIDPELAGYKDQRIGNLYDELERRLAALPGVVSASYSSEVLLDNGLWTSSVHIEGHSDKSTVETNMLAVGPAFFETMRIPLMQGRTLRQADFHSGRAVAIVNEAFAREFLGGRQPIGMHFGGTGDRDPRDPQREIVGIVADAKYDDLRKAVVPTAYIPLTEGQAHFTLRTGPSPGALIPAVRRIVNDLDSELPIFDVRTQSQAIDRLMFNERLLARFSSLFGLLALTLALHRALWPGVLRSGTAHKRDRHSHGAGRATTRCPAHGCRTRIPAGLRWRVGWDTDRHRSHAISAEPSVWSSPHRSIYFSGGVPGARGGHISGVLRSSATGHTG